MASVDLNTVRELWGHKTTIMTFRHSHFSRDRKVCALEARANSTDTFSIPDVKSPRKEILTYVDELLELIEL